MATAIVYVSRPLPPCNVQKGSWTSYTEQLHFYFEAQEITSSEIKHSVLLSARGTKTYEMLKNLVYPVPLKDKSYKDLVAAMDTH